MAGKRLSRLGTYIATIYRKWWALALGEIPFLTALAVRLFIHDNKGRAVSIPTWVWVALAFLGLVVAQFAAWSDVTKRVDTLELRLQPKLRVSSNNTGECRRPDVPLRADPPYALAPNETVGESYVRLLKVENLSGEVLHSVRAEVTATSSDLNALTAFPLTLRWSDNETHTERDLAPNGRAYVVLERAWVGSVTTQHRGPGYGWQATGDLAFTVEVWGKDCPKDTRTFHLLAGQQKAGPTLLRAIQEVELVEAI